MSAGQASKMKALCVATRATNVDEFVATFHRFCDADSFFIATLNTRPVGLETAFSIQLADGTPVLRGLCVVRDAWPDTDNPFGRPGIRLAIVRLTRESTPVFERLRLWRTVNESPSREPAAPSTRAASSTPPDPVPVVPALPPILPPGAPRPAAPPVAAPVAAPRVVPPRVVPPQPVAAQVAEVAPVAQTTQTVTPLEIRILRADPPAQPPVADASARAGEAPIARGSAQPVSAALTPDPLATTFVAPPAMAAPAPPTPRASVPVMPTPAAPRTTPIDATPTAPPIVETRTPGSDIVLPANPLMNLTDASLEGFVDCTLFEGHAGFPIDEMTPLPGVATVGSYALPPIEPALVGPTDAPPPAVASPPPAVMSPPSLGAPAPATAPVVVAEPVAPVADLVAAPTAPPWYRRLHPLHRVRQLGRQLPVHPAVLISAAAVLVGAIVVALVLRSCGSAASVPEGPSSASASTSPIGPGSSGSATITPPSVRPSVDPPTTPSVKPPVDPPAAGSNQPRAAAGSASADGPCRVTIVSAPAGAQVHVDGQPVGVAPLTVGGPCQRRRIEVSSPRYQTVSRWASPTEGKVETIEVTLPRPSHALTVVTQPPGATVSLDGRPAGTSPAKLKIPGYQPVEVTVQKPGYQPVTKRIYSRNPDDRIVINLRGTAPANPR